MGLFFVYILKSTACLAILYLFYRLLLSKETFHRFNRVALLGLFLLSAIIPFCQLSIDKPGEIQQSVLDMEQLLLITPFAREITTPFISWIEVGFFIYLTGVVFFFLRSLYSLISIFLLIRKGESVVQKNGIVTVVHILPVAPFSWMKYIVISKQDMEENGREILIHENAHISNHHSIDLIIAELCILFHWFNPASWLFKQELQNIHEYEADETVINQGVDAKQYQLLLIKKAVGTRLYSMATALITVHLKKELL